MSQDRLNKLERLISLSESVDRLEASISNLEWDSDEELVTLTSEQVVLVLDRALAGSLSLDELDRWANLIECREDIKFGKDQSDRDKVKQAIYRLANLELVGGVNEGTVAEIRKELVAKDGGSDHGNALRRRKIE